MLTMSSIANNRPHVMRKRLILRQFMQVDQYNTFVVHYLVVVYLWFISRQSEEPKKISVGIFEYILASMLKVFLNM